MDPTLHDGQNLLLLRCDWNPLLPIKHGDIVVADYHDIRVIKRVIACPNDTLQITDNRIYLNGRLLNEPYLNQPMNTTDLPLTTLGENQYFLMGDNRNNSSDSRHFGCFTKDALFGVAYLDQQILLWTCFFGFILIVLIFAFSQLSDNRKENAYDTTQLE